MNREFYEQKLKEQKLTYGEVHLSDLWIMLNQLRFQADLNMQNIYQSHLNVIPKHLESTNLFTKAILSPYNKRYNNMFYREWMSHTLHIVWRECLVANVKNEQMTFLENLITDLILAENECEETYCKISPYPASDIPKREKISEILRKAHDNVPIRNF